MPEGSVEGLTYQQAFDGIPASSFGGGVGPSVAVIFAFADGILPVDCETCSIQEFPGSKFAVGASGGSLVVLATLVNSGNDKNFNITGGGSVLITDGFWPSLIRSAVAAVNIDDIICGFTVQWVSHDINSFAGPELTETTSPTEIIDSNYDPDTEKGDNTFTFTYDNAAAEDPTSFAVKRTDSLGNSVLVGSLVFHAGQTDYQYTDYSITAPGAYTYTLIPYKLSTSSKGPESIAPGSEPDIAIIMGLEFAEDFSSIIIALADPSGIYTLVPGKTHDTLYERTGVDHVDIAIPEPYGRTSYVP